MSSTRRQLLQLALAAPLAAAPRQETVIGMPFPSKNPRIGLIGTGGRGTSLLANFLAADAQVTALCDILPQKTRNAVALVSKAGQPSPETYTESDKLLSRQDLDLVVIATPWKFHTPMAVAAMKLGKHVFIEVPAALTLAECWQLVDTSETTRRHCIMLENCCYGANELLILNMVRAGIFGDLLYGAAAYNHDLREELFSSTGEGLWRRTAHTENNGNLYPTHGLGPVANYMGINRGDRFDYLVSMSSPQRGLDQWRTEHTPKDDPKWRERYVTGDMNTSLIKTVNGLTITLQHDVSNPRPYSRLNQIAGTKGLFEDYPPRIYIEGQEGGEKWFSLDRFKPRFEHALWKEQGTTAAKLGGHGGMDFLECYRHLQCMRQGLVPDLDVYDAAAWCAPSPLSYSSVAQGSAPIAFPDFTRGRWKDRKGSAI